MMMGYINIERNYNIRSGEKWHRRWTDEQWAKAEDGLAAMTKAKIMIGGKRI